MHRRVFQNSWDTMTLLPCTMENGAFVTNVKWKVHGLVHVRHKRYYYSPDLFLHDPIKSEPIKIQLRLLIPPRGFKSISYHIELKIDDQWRYYSSIHLQNIRDDFEHTLRFLNNIYYSRKNLKADLRQYLKTIHGETFAFGGKTYSIHDCFKGIMLAFIEQEYNQDFVIECEGKEFKIKKIILQARSPVFNTMLSNNNFKEARENRMVIKDCGSEVVEKMLEFFQTDFVMNTIDFEVELYEIARKYMSESFMEFTRLPFVQTLTIENYDKRLETVMKHDDKETEELMKAWYTNQLGRQ